MSKEKLIYLPVGILTVATMVCGAVLGGVNSYAEGVTKTASVEVTGACSFTAGQDHTSALTLVTGDANTEQETGKPSMTASCNDVNGFSIYAMGVDEDGEPSTDLVGVTGWDIHTGTSGEDNSYWAMKIKSATNGDPQNGFAIGTYHAVPSANTEILKVAGSTSGAATTTVRTDYMVHVASNQPAGTYTGGVKYTLVHSGTANNGD